MNFQKYKDVLRPRLTEKRYYHSLCVADEAKRLAEIYGADADKMYLAGLLHDIAKYIPREEQLQTLRDSGIILSDVEMASEPVWHSVCGAVVVKNELGISDTDILSAIRYHTTAKAAMTLPEKILFIADLTSADRDFPDIERLRTQVSTDLDGAILYALSYTLSDLAIKHIPIHPDTLGAYNYLIVNGKDK